MPSDKKADTSLTLLERLQNNPDDPQAWSLFVERYQPRIRRWCVTWGLQDCDADDVSQDVLIKLFGALRKFRYDPERSFRAWLKTVTQHAWFDFLAARRKDPSQTRARMDRIVDSAEAQSDLERQIEDAFEHELLEVATRHVKKRVKPATWEAFHLTVIEGSTGAAAALRLQIPVAHIFVAKRRVQRMLQEEVRMLKNDPSSGGRT